MENEQMCFGLGIYDEIFMEINMWQWLMEYSMENIY